MKTQIARLSPHQNGKVAGVLMAVVSLIFLIPVFLIVSMIPGSSSSMPIWTIFIAPIFYLVFTYVFTVIACALYNVVVPMVGGIEYDATPLA